MALQLDGNEFEAIRDKFLAIDTDGDGQLTRAELSEHFGNGKSDKVEFTIKLMDLDNKEKDRECAKRVHFYLHARPPRLCA